MAATYRLNFRGRELLKGRRHLRYLPTTRMRRLEVAGGTGKSSIFRKMSPPWPPALEIQLKKQLLPAASVSRMIMVQRDSAGLAHLKVMVCIAISLLCTLCLKSWTCLQMPPVP